MKFKPCFAMLVLLLLSALCLAQVPTPPLAGPFQGGKDISFTYIMGERDRLAYYGWGGELAASHFLTKNVGFQAETDYLRTNYSNLRDMGVRVGPIVRLWTQHAVQPYVHVLIGYAIIKSSYLKPETSFNGGGSILAGGGVYFPVYRGWYARAGADFENDWTTVATRVGRGTVGVAYKFGNR